MSTINMSFRVDKETKEKADKLFKKMGMNTSVAINMFLNQCIIEDGLPFTPSNKTKSSDYYIRKLKELNDETPSIKASMEDLYNYYKLIEEYNENSKI